MISDVKKLPLFHLTEDVKYLVEYSIVRNKIRAVIVGLEVNKYLLYSKIGSYGLDSFIKQDEILPYVSPAQRRAPRNVFIKIQRIWRERPPSFTRGT